MKCKKLGEGVSRALVDGGFLPGIPVPDATGEYDLPLKWGSSYVTGSGYYYAAPNGSMHLRLTEDGELLLVSPSAEAEAWATAEPAIAARRKAHDEEDPKGSYPVG